MLAGSPPADGATVPGQASGWRGGGAPQRAMPLSPLEEGEEEEDGDEEDDAQANAFSFLPMEDEEEGEEEEASALLKWARSLPVH